MDLLLFFLQNFSTRHNGFKDISDYRKDHTAEQSKNKIKKLIR